MTNLIKGVVICSRTYASRKEQAMTSTPTDLDAALDAAVSTLPEDESPQSTVKETEAPNETEAESASDDGQKETETAKEPEGEEESFTEKKLSFNELPDDLKPIYRDWQKQYTQKRQAEKAHIAELEAKVKQLEQQPKADSQPLSPQQQKAVQGLTPEQLEEYLDIRDQNRYIENQERDFKTLDDRLIEDSPEYDPWLYNGIIGELSRQRDAYEAKNKTIIGFDFIGEAKKLISKYDQKIKQQGGEFIKQKTEQSKAIMEKSKKENPKAKSLDGRTIKALDLDEAVDSAFARLNS